MRILFFGDDVLAVGVLRRLFEVERRDVVAVVLRAMPRNDALRAYANGQGLEVLQPRDVNGDEFHAIVSARKADLNLVVNYDQIFRARLIGSAGLGSVNCHNGLLPLYRGGGGLYGAVINDERQFGQTVHWMDEGIDTGDIILQEVLPIAPTDYMDDLQAKSAANLPGLVSRALALIQQPGFVGRAQAAAPATYFPHKPDGDEIIEWGELSRLLVNRIRARNPGPGNATFLKDRKLYVWRASMTDTPPYVGSVGQVIQIDRGRGVRVKTGDSAILLEEIQFEGGEREVPRFPLGTTFLANWRAAYVEVAARCRELDERLRRLEERLGGPRSARA